MSALLLWLLTACGAPAVDPAALDSLRSCTPRGDVDVDVDGLPTLPSIEAVTRRFGVRLTQDSVTTGLAARKQAPSRLVTRTIAKGPPADATTDRPPVPAWLERIAVDLGAEVAKAAQLFGGADVAVALEVDVAITADTPMRRVGELLRLLHVGHVATVGFVAREEGESTLVWAAPALGARLAAGEAVGWPACAEALEVVVTQAAAEMRAPLIARLVQDGALATCRGAELSAAMTHLQALSCEANPVTRFDARLDPKGEAVPIGEDATWGETIGTWSTRYAGSAIWPALENGPATR